MTETTYPTASNIRLLVSDVDGTLLNSKGQLSEKTIEVIQKVTKQYPLVKFVISTGKSEHAIQPLRDQLKLNDTPNHPTSCINGCVIYNENNKVIKEYIIPPESVIDIINLCENYLKDKTLFSFGCYSRNDMIFIRKDFHYHRLRDFYNENTVYIEREEFFQRVLSSDISINKICIFNKDIDVIKEFRKIKLEPFIETNSVLCMTQTGADCLEVMPKDGNKGSSLKNLLETYQFTNDQVIVFGDGENDIPMFDVSAHGVAMENAVDCLKEHANYISKSNDEDGLAVFLEKVFLS
ncbi:hypothetical protein BCR36DRAFT_356445 [Piromyces finnis]|uniref:HAD-like protein n=1 Tax=Piromyces finnis TaxID=1754191 RepID=A0A1Y1V549_9FUNG|nr:hypothetical protein BCR36DRAFT_356445 [Piromyces finnis]|eukprot:ORX46922.1 hypothetical protein BCR36DRAFT_356445 [Piromyces finnis]